MEGPRVGALSDLRTKSGGAVGAAGLLGLLVPEVRVAVGTEELGGVGVVVEEAVGALEWVGGGQEGAEEGTVGVGVGGVLLGVGE